MIKSVTVTNPKGEQLTLELTRPEKSGIYIKSIDGIGPAKATINTTNFATIDGSFFSSSRIEERNIVFDLGFLFDPTIEDVRQKCYKFFPVKKQVDLLFETDNRVVRTSGYVESSEPNIFSEMEDMSVSIVCPDPNFYEVQTVETAYIGWHPKFEFPFSSEAQNPPNLVFGEYENNTTAIVNYKGDVSSGMVMTLRALDEIGDISILRNDTNESFLIDTKKIKKLTGLPFSKNDEIIISTNNGNKHITLIRHGVQTNIISCINKESSWFQLDYGENEFLFDAVKNVDKLIITFSYKNAYGGI